MSTATDSANPEHSTATSLSPKRPGFYITISPTPSNPGDYRELIGSTEQDIDSAKIEVTDASGKILHTFTSPVGTNGYLSYSIHGDREPGRYTVTVSTPSLKAPYRTIMSVVAPEGTLPVPTIMTP